MGQSQFEAKVALANGLLILHIVGILRFAGGLFAMFLFLSACATVASDPRLSRANVRQIADAEVRRVMEIDLRQYKISGPHYISRGDYWSVTCYLKANKRGAFSVRVSDKIQKAFIKRHDGGIFEGALTEKPLIIRRTEAGLSLR